MKVFKSILSVLLVLFLVFPMMPVRAEENASETANMRSVQNSIIIDDDPTGGYEGDYVVIYNPATSSSTSYSTGTMTGLIETSVSPNIMPDPSGNQKQDTELPIWKIDIDSKLRDLAEIAPVEPVEDPVKASYNVGSTKTFTLVNVNTNGTYSLQFECLYVGQHCYIWTPTSTTGTYYPLDEIDSTFAKLAADEFDSKFDLMQSSFGNHTNGSQGDGKLHMLYYNIDDGWNGSGGYIAGFFYQGDLSSNGVPILNIDTYPGVYYKNPNSGNVYKRMDDTYNTMVHEYQHLINYSNTNGMSSWLNECFSAAAEEICYPGSSVVGRIQSWENYYYSTNDDWLNPPAEFEYQSDFSLHNGYSLYAWSNGLTDVLALYAQVSFFAQYLYTRFGNTIYKQISGKYSSSEVSAITSATGVSCSDLARDFRVAVTANAAQSQYGGIYGFKVQDGYDPANYYNVQNPWDLLSPVVFTGSSCSIKGGGAITVKPVNGVYNPPSGANSNLKYIGIKLASPYTVTAVSNNEAWGTVSVEGTKITATPASGYYVSDYEVLSGTATAVIDGNIVRVTPESDCTIKVIFAPRPVYTVNFIAAGNAEGSQTAMGGDPITLPTSVSVNPDGWTFIGWTAGEVPEETTDRPLYYPIGDDYAVTKDETLYAVYSRTEEGTGEIIYELVSAAPADWVGNYVITYGTDTAMYLMKGVTPSSNGAQIESKANASSYAVSGVTLTGTTLTNVGNSYLFTFAPHGSYYSIQSVSAGTYLGMDSGSYLAGYTAYTSGYCDWTPGVKENASTASNATNGSYPLISFYTGDNYFWSGNPNNQYAPSVRLWKENTGDTVYYSTNPVTNAPGYYLIGSVTEWAVDTTKKFEPNPENASEYMLPITLAAGDEFKAVKAEGTTILAWYPDQGTNYVVGANQAGDVTVYFRPDGQGGDGWHYGYLYIAVPAPEEPAFMTQSLALEGKIAVNFFVKLPVREGYAYQDVTFAISSEDEGAEKVVPYSTDLPKNNKGYYRFTCYVRSIQMADTITATLHYTVNGAAQTLVKEYSVKEYFETYDEYKALFSDEEQNLTEALADFGYYVQAYLDSVRDWNAPDDYAKMDKRYTTYGETERSEAQTQLNDYKIVRNTSTDITKITFSLLLDSDTAIQVFFTPAKSYTGTPTFTLDGNTVTAELQSDGRYMVEIPNIPAHELSRTYEILVTTANGTATVRVSGLSYAKAMLDAYANNELAVDAAVAIYRYSKFADALMN